MASSVAGVIGWGVSDGETLDATATRWSTVSRFDVSGGATALQSAGGIIPAGGDPLGVAALGTPAMKVTIKAGSCVIPGNSASTPPFGLTLLANTDLDVAAAHATLSRIDLVIAKVTSPGTSAAAGSFEVLTGTAAASPVRPTLPNTGNDHSISLKQILVDPAVTTIVAGKVTHVTGSDAWYTVAPGGTHPVKAYTATSQVLDHQPFISVTDNLPGIKLPAGGAVLWGHATRFFYGNVTTNVNGDISCTYGLHVNGGFVAIPFPNAILAAIAIEATPVVSYSSPVVVKWTSDASTAAIATFRLFNAADGAPLSNLGPITFAMIAIGR